MKLTINQRYIKVSETIEELMQDDRYNPADKLDWLRDLQSLAEECISDLQLESDSEDD